MGLIELIQFIMQSMGTQPTISQRPGRRRRNLTPRDPFQPPANLGPTMTGAIRPTPARSPFGTATPTTKPQTGGLTGIPARMVAGRIEDLRGIKPIEQAAGGGYWYIDPVSGAKVLGGGPGMPTPRAERRHLRSML